MKLILATFAVGAVALLAFAAAPVPAADNVAQAPHGSVSQRSAVVAGVPITPTEFELARAQVASELAEHPEWPQRPVTTDGTTLFVPSGPHDPTAYHDWLGTVGSRYEAVQLVYTPGKTDPTRAQLQAISDDLWQRIDALKVSIDYLAINIDEDTGTVNARYSPAIPEVVTLFAKAKTKYGDLFTYSESAGAGAYSTH